MTPGEFSLEKQHRKPSDCLFLPSVLSEELVLELFQVLAESLLLLSRLLELLHQLLPVKKRQKQNKKTLKTALGNTTMTDDCVIQRWKTVWNTFVALQKRLDLDR